MFLMDIQREQVDGVRAFLADPANGAGQLRLIPVLRARVTGVSGRETQLESFEDVRARGSLAASTRSPIAIISNRTNASSKAPLRAYRVGDDAAVEEDTHPLGIRRKSDWMLGTWDLHR